VEKTRTYVATAYGVSVVFILMVGFNAFDPRSQISALARVGLFAVLFLFVIGILPGSFLARWVVASSRILGILAPVVFIAVAAVALANNYAMLELLESTNSTTVDRGWVEFDLVRYWTIGLASVAWLVVEIAIIFGRRSGARAARS
jgi:hypothetical protein